MYCKYVEKCVSKNPTRREKAEYKPDVEYTKVSQKVLSLTALEFLALGKKVIYHWTRETLADFPGEHRLRKSDKQTL